MDQKEVLLARRAVRSLNWTWMDGLVVHHPQLGGDYCLMGGKVHLDHTAVPLNASAHWLPVLGAPATRGCVLEMVRAANNNPHLSTTYSSGGWWVGTVGPRATEEEALVAALEQPKQRVHSEAA